MLFLYLVVYKTWLLVLEFAAHVGTKADWLHLHRRLTCSFTNLSCGADNDSHRQPGTSTILWLASVLPPSVLREQNCRRGVLISSRLTGAKFTFYRRRFHLQHQLNSAGKHHRAPSTASAEKRGCGFRSAAPRIRPFPPPHRCLLLHLLRHLLTLRWRLPCGMGACARPAVSPVRCGCATPARKRTTATSNARRIIGKGVLTKKSARRCWCSRRWRC